MKTHAQFKREVLKDPEVRRAYEALGPEYEVIAAIMKRRIEKGLTQQQLAKRVGTQQSAIARLESGNYNPSLEFLQRVSQALGARLRITLR